jgi:hypothetical protein
MRRCSFSSSVLARFRGGRLVLGSGSTCPHDFRFLTDLPSAAGVDEACDMSRADEGAGEGVSKGTWRSSILMVVGTESVVGGVIGPDAIKVGVVMAWEK